MAFDWAEYLQVARLLAGDQSAAASEEAKERCAVSRAYYAAFCCARNVLDLETGKYYAGGDCHKKVREAFLSSQEKSRRRVGNQLNTLFYYRRNADYRSDYPDTGARRRELINSLKMSAEVLHALDELGKDQTDL